MERVFLYLISDIYVRTRVRENRICRYLTIYLRISVPERSILMENEKNEMKACIFNIQRFSIHDGPGIRTTVFFKGCPLNCTWCSNPESQIFTPEEIWDNIKKGYVITGEYMKVKDITDIIMKDIDYYNESGGGVTLSGGEVLAQSEFALELLDECRKMGIHTACETAAYVNEETFRDFISHVDLVIVDIKHYDEEKHKAKTGVGLELILKNIKYVVETKKDMILRLPVIPGYNDSLEDAENFVSLLKNYGIQEIEILPFHQFGKNKYKFLNRKYEFENSKQIKKEDLAAYVEIFNENGINCIIA